MLSAKIDEPKGLLIITLPLESKPYTTDKGNTVIASTHGNQTVVVDGKAVTIGLNAYLRK